MSLDAMIEQKKEVPTRYLILLIIFIVTAVNYADRATLSIAGTEVAKELQLSAVSMGYIFSAFGWAYLLMQIPGGWLLDKFGSKKVYSYSLFFWSLFTFLQGFVDMFPLAWAGISMFFMRFMLGFSEAPSFPANARIVAAWFPTKERGTASAIFNSAQYFSLALFSPLLGSITPSMHTAMPRAPSSQPITPGPPALMPKFQPSRAMNSTLGPGAAWAMAMEALNCG